MRPAVIARFGIIFLVMGWFALFAVMDGCKQKSPVNTSTRKMPLNFCACKVLTMPFNRSRREPASGTSP